MAQTATNPKIEELRFRLKSDPKSRIFFPLAEELRKISQLAEAEQVLRTGLTNHPTYLSAWVSLGRVLHDLHKDQDAAEALNKALQLDPGNVVAARLLADAYLALGEKVEAIKKYKLVYALLPGDESLEGIIERLDREINAPAVIPEPVLAAPEESPFDESPAPPAAAAEIVPPEVAADAAPAPSFVPPVFEPPPFDSPATAVPAAEGGIWDDTDQSRVFHDATASLRRERTTEAETGDAEPMRAAHDESPFEEPGSQEGYGAAAFAIEQPTGMHAVSAPLSAETPEPLPLAPLPSELQAVTEPPAETAAEEADVFEPADSGLAPGIVTEPFAVTSTLTPIDAEDFARTITMADLYANQGLVDEARDIYEDLLARDPGNEVIRAKLDALAAVPAASFEAPAEEGPWEPEPATEPLAAEPHAEPEPPGAADSAFAPPSSEPAASELPLGTTQAAEAELPPPSTTPAGDAPASQAKLDKLTGWLERVKRGEGRV